jgi:hypothetical protein
LLHGAAQRLAPEALTRFEQQLTLTEFLARPTLDDDTLRLVGEALPTTQDVAQRRTARQVVQALARVLVEAPAATVRQGLESALQHLGPSASPGKSYLFGLVRFAAPADRWAGLFRELLDLLGSDEQALANADLLFALLSVGLNTGTSNTWVARQHDGRSRRDTAAFLATLERSCSAAVLDDIADHVRRDWAKDEAALRWWRDVLAR